jgi:hypothetical protein
MMDSKTDMENAEKSSDLPEPDSDSVKGLNRTVRPFYNALCKNGSTRARNSHTINQTHTTHSDKAPVTNGVKKRTDIANGVKTNGKRSSHLDKLLNEVRLERVPLRHIVSSSHGKTSSNVSVVIYDLQKQSYLLVRRHHSTEFISIVTGHFRPVHLIYLTRSITEPEREQLLEAIRSSEHLKQMLSELIGGYKQFQAEHNYALQRFAESRELLRTLLKEPAIFKERWEVPRASGPHTVDAVLRLINRQLGVKEFVPFISLNALQKSSTRSVNGVISQTQHWLYLTGDFPDSIQLSSGLAQYRWVTESQLIEYLGKELDNLPLLEHLRREGVFSSNPCLTAIDDTDQLEQPAIK